MHELLVILSTAEHDQLEALLATFRRNNASISDESLVRSIFLYGISALIALQNRLAAGASLDGYGPLGEDPPYN